MRNALLVALAAIGVIAACPAWAQQQDGGIVVTGQKGEPLERARKFVRQVIRQKELKLARFEDPVCVQVSGLAPKYNEAIAERYRDVAQATRVKLAPERCEPNVLVLFVDDADSFIAAARKRFPKVFSQLTDTDLRHALAQGPVHAWRNVATIDDMGRVIATERYGFEDRSGYDWVPVPEDAGPAPIRAKVNTHAATVNSVIVMDRKAVHRKSPVQIADYAAMRTLVGARPPAKESIASDSILSLFDANVSPAPLEVSDMDLALLGGLYALDTPTQNAEIEMARISRGMVSAPKRD